MMLTCTSYSRGNGNFADVSERVRGRCRKRRMKIQECDGNRELPHEEVGFQ